MSGTPEEASGSVFNSFAVFPSTATAAIAKPAVAAVSEVDSTLGFVIAGGCALE